MWSEELRRVSLSGCEWFLKGPYSWRKSDFGEKSYLWLAFFNLWNRRTKISSVEYLWLFLLLFLFVLQSLDLFCFFFNLCSTCASFRRGMFNLFVCSLLSKLFPLIIAVCRYFKTVQTVLMTAMWFVQKGDAFTWEKKPNCFVFLN